MDSNRVEHLKMIQTVIERMARNSFWYKGWALTVFAALLILSKPQCVVIDLLGIVPLALFWGLDAYYLKQERLYRKLYDEVRNGGDEKTDFSMNAAKFSQQVSWVKVAMSKSIFWFYIWMVAVIVVKAIFM